MNPSLLIRKAKEEDLRDVLTLYAQLGNNPFPQNLEEVLPVWHQILAQPGHFCKDLYNFYSDILVLS